MILEFHDDDEYATVVVFSVDSMVDSMKLEYLAQVINKYSLEELEQRLP